MTCVSTGPRVGDVVSVGAVGGARVVTARSGETSETSRCGATHFQKGSRVCFESDHGEVKVLPLYPAGATHDRAFLRPSPNHSSSCWSRPQRGATCQRKVPFQLQCIYRMNTAHI